MKKVHLCSITHERASTGEAAAITITTQDPDRYEDILIPEGADVSHYERNPVVLFGHDAYSLPVGRTQQLRVMPGKGIVAEFTFLKGDPFADRVKNAFDQRVLNGASVGFIPKKSEPLKNGGRKYTQWELVEWSLVSTPANPNAVRVLKSLGLDGPAPLARASITSPRSPTSSKAVASSRTPTKRDSGRPVISSQPCFRNRITTSLRTTA